MEVQGNDRPPHRRVERVRHELRRRDVEVARVEPLGGEFMRVVFAGDALHGFDSMSFDDHVKFMFGDDGSGKPFARDYTPRRFDAARNELTIDFALHGDGATCAWAREASVGAPAVVGGPRGSFIVPTDFDWHLLAGDASAAPAIGRRLAELPRGARAIVVVELGDLAALELPESAAQVELHQVESADALVAAVERLPLPDGEGYAWAAGEAAAMARVRDVLLGAKRHPLEATRVAAYWKRGTPTFHQDLGR